MQVAIARDYFPAYARLPRKAQSKADDFLRKFTADLGEQGSAEGSAEMAGNRMHMIFGPGKKSSKKTTTAASLRRGCGLAARPPAPRRCAGRR